jgi:hypothetical protein
MTERSWIQTYTGRKVWPLAMKFSDVCIEDIAHSLANQCRFTGHVKEFYGVAQHSVLVSYYCDPEDALWGLLHDATEAYLIDVPRPLKQHPDFAFYRSAETDCMFAIAAAFMLPLPMPESVHVADHRLLATESRDLMAPLHPDWIITDEPYRRRIVSWTPESAEIAFLTRFRRLTTNFPVAKFDGLDYRGAEVVA